MATSDSEDFESADEDWSNEDKVITSVRSKVELSQSNPKTSVPVKYVDNESGKSVSNPEIMHVSKSIKETLMLDEEKLETSTHKPLVNSSEESVSDKRVAISKPPDVSIEKESEYTSIIQNSQKPSETNEIQVEVDLNSEENSDLVVDCGGKTLISDNSMNDQLESKNDEQESISSSGKDEGMYDCKAETDGWECDDHIIEDLVEEKNINPNVNYVLDKLSDSAEKEISNSDSASWSGWGSWGVTSLLSTATESVSTLTKEVSQGLSTVLETGLGVPDAEELAKQEMEHEKKLIESIKAKSEVITEEEAKEVESSSLFGFGRVFSGVSSITKLVETASSKVVSGGLDTLETIGKKTMEVLQEGDPGLRKKRSIFSEKVVLSQILREAKEKAEQENQALRSTEEARKVHFETLFDDYHGLVHLEALEMLSKQCSIKLQSVLLSTPATDIPELQKSITDIKDLCQLPDEEDTEIISFESVEEKLTGLAKGLGVPVANDKLAKTWKEVHLWTKDCRSKQNCTGKDAGDFSENVPNAQEIYRKAIDTLARLTAEAVEQFHKSAELLLVYEKRKPVDEANIFLEMTSVFSLEVSTAATAFCEILNTCSENAENHDSVNSNITNIYLEAANSSSYIQEAFHLLLPVLQVGIVAT